MPVDFSRLRGVAGLARVAGCTTEYVEGVLRDRGAHYKERHIPKRKPSHPGDRRTVHQADEALKQAQREVLARLEDWVIEQNIGYPTPQAHGFVRKRGILSNAKNHVAAPMLLRADIEHFFPSIRLERVQQVFVGRLSVDRAFAEMLTEFLSPNNSLAEGVCASPFLANLVCIDLDRELAELAKEKECSYSRYADDLAFSGEGVPTRIEVSSICQRHAFKLSKRKFRITKIGQAHYVTGLSVSDKTRPRAPKAFKRRLRQELYYSRRFGLDAHLSKAAYSSFQYGINSIDGRLRFLGGVEPELVRKLRILWSEILSKHEDRPGPTYASATYAPLPEIHGFIDTTKMRDGRLAMALVMTTEAAYLEGSARALLNDLKDDPWAGARAGKLESKGLHFTDNPVGVQEKYIELLAGMPVKAYVAISKNGGSAGDAYQALLRVLLKDRVRRNHDARISIVYEEGDGVTQSEVEAVVRDIVSEIKVRNAAATISISTRIGTKKADIGLSSADYLLGVLRAYWQPTRDFDATRFERLRGKFRLIVDLDSAERWHRKRPLVRTVPKPVQPKPA